MSPRRQFGTEISGNAVRKPRIDRDTRSAVYALFKNGIPAAEIATRYGTDRRNVYRIAQRFESTGSHADRPRPGAPKCLTNRAERIIQRAAPKEPSRTLNSLRRAVDSNPSTRTVSRILAKAGLFTYVARKRSSLTIAHRRARLEFATKFRGKVNWSRLIFTDESSFVLGKRFGCQFIRRRPGTEWEDKHVREEGKSRSSMMFWGGIAIDGKSRLIPVHGGMNAANYATVLTEGYFNLQKELEGVYGIVEGVAEGPTAQTGESIVFLQQDNATAHTAKATVKFFEENNIKVFAKWPANSPDLNPIEHVWAILKRRVYAFIEERKTVFTQSKASKDEFRELVLKTWDAIAQEEIRPLILNMDERLEAVIKAKGGHTHY
jgi:transposase